MSLNFEWDQNKADSNFKKHGISFEEASTVFGDHLSLTIPDPLHSVGEERFMTIGGSHQGRTIVIVHVDKNDIIRIVSARLATKYEKKDYEENKKN